MTIVVEDGTGLPNANSYVSEADADAYATDRGHTDWVDSAEDKEAALIRATAAIDAIYGYKFSGWRVNGRDQALEWPRTGAYDREENVVVDDSVPVEVEHATVEAAIRELASPGSMMPDLERGGDIRRLKAGSVEVEYAATAAATTTRQIIDGILAPLFGTGVVASFVGRAVRR